ncbi:inorganic triphosphatase [Sphingomonas glacialis]|uniref:Inorganic triphosphatase n=1 Tax=Sphingomonas glacialis TaxID=658225 RepID=A0ABQ3LSM2_9SPHN|nr:CHAD domain-containing protein [Sphingomonas glacialis]GHH24689.1 inorganic triphosphatase [Sphingomonas glacialis]
MTGPPLETELKLDVDVQDGSTVYESLITSFGRPTAHHHLISTYFDTTEDHLWHAGITLRVRRDGRRRIQTIKVEGGKAAGLFSRPEWECDIAGETPDLDLPTAGLLTKLADAEITADTLQQVFTTDIARTIWLVDSEGATIEIADDDGTITTKGRDEAIHELEFELKKGTCAALFTLAAKIGATVPLRIGVRSKAERGQALRTSDVSKALEAEPIALGKDLTTAAGFQAIAGGCIRHYRLNEGLLLEATDSETLHQCRVALRRLRAALTLFKPILRDPESIALSDRLRTAAALFGDARNIDVLIDRIADPKLLATLTERRKAICAELLSAIGADNFRALMLDLVRWTSVGCWLSEKDTAEKRHQPITAFAGHVLDRYQRRLNRRGRHLARLSDENRHKIRIVGKKLGYAADFFGTLFAGKKARRRRQHFRQAITALQSELGSLNDETTGAELLKHFTPLAVPSKADAALAASSKNQSISRAADAYEMVKDIKRFWR